MHLFYARHFALLMIAILLSTMIAQTPLGGAMAACFACYGALHASAVVLSLRAPPRWQRSFLFIATAAALSVGTLYVGIFGGRLYGPPGRTRLYSMVAICAALGALVYGSLIRIFWMPALRSRAIAAMALCCVMTAAAALWWMQSSSGRKLWWLTSLWWLSLSLALMIVDRRPAAISQFKVAS